MKSAQPGIIITHRGKKKKVKCDTTYPTKAQPAKQHNERLLTKVCLLYCLVCLAIKYCMEKPKSQKNPSHVIFVLLTNTLLIFGFLWLKKKQQYVKAKAH